MSWWQMKRDVPMFAVMFVAPACVFPDPYARPKTDTLHDPFSQQFEEITASIPQVTNPENATGIYSLQMLSVDCQHRLNWCADVTGEPDSGDHAAFGVERQIACFRVARVSY